MSSSSLTARIKRSYRRFASSSLAKRPFTMRNREPVISFTFDDFPRSALSVGGDILEGVGARGTYYTSLGLEGQTAPTGEIFLREDLLRAVERGHELGCHTFSHCHAGETAPDTFEEAIVANRQALQALTPGVEFQTLSYPIGHPTPEIKRRCEKHFLACREGGQKYNLGTIDLNRLNAFFIEQSRQEPEAINALIDASARANGWLIFATHDVSNDPTRYGCSPDLFAAIVKRAEKSARILPVSSALAEIGVATASN